MTTPTRVAAGQPIGRILRASTINYALEGAELAHKLATGTPTTTRGNQRAGTALVRNDTGGDIDRFSVLGITGVVIDPGDGDEEEQSFKNGFVLTGDSPDLDRDGGARFCVLQEPCQDGEFAIATLTGLTPVKINKDEDETYTGASLISGDTDKLQAGGDDCAVVWHEEGTGEKWAVANLGASGECGYYHQFVVIGGSALPTSGSHIFEYTIDSDSQNVTIDYDMTASELKTHILTQFSALESTDLETDGGPWPQIPLEVRWKGEVAEQVATDSPPTIGTNTLNNNCWAGVWPVPSWGR